MEKETNFLDMYAIRINFSTLFQHRIKKGKQSNTTKPQPIQQDDKQPTKTTAKQMSTTSPTQKSNQNKIPTTNREKSINLADIKVQELTSDNIKSDQKAKQGELPIKKQGAIHSATQNNPQQKPRVETSATDEVIHRKVPNEPSNSILTCSR